MTNRPRRPLPPPSLRLGIGKSSLTRESRLLGEILVLQSQTRKGVLQQRMGIRLEEGMRQGGLDGGNQSVMKTH